MTVINVSSKPVEILVNNGSNTLDVSAAFDYFRVESDEWQPTGWWKPTVTLVLKTNLATALGESFDPRINPSRWEPDNLVTISVNFGSPTGIIQLPWRLKIAEWPARPHPGQRTLTLKLVGDPDLLSYRAPEGDAGGVTYGISTSRTALINAMLTQANCPTLASGDTITDYPLPFSPEKKQSGPWIDFAGDVAWTANRVLWQQADGGIRVATLTLDGLTPIAHYVVGKDEVRYQPDAPGNLPPQQLRVTGTTYDLTDVEDQEFINTDTVNGHVVKTTINYNDRDTTTPETIETVEEELGQFLPEIYPGSTTLTTSTKTTKGETYDNIADYLTQEIETVERPVAAVHPSYRWNSPTQIIIATRTTIDYDHDSDANVTKRTTTVEESVVSGSSPVLTTVQVIIERWNNLGAEDFGYSRSVSNQRTNAQSIPTRKPRGGVVRPPAAKYRPAQKNKREVEFSSTLEFASPTGGGYQDKLQSINLPGGLAVSNAQCQAIGEFWGSFRHASQWPLLWAAPLTPDWLQSFTPVRAVDFTVDGVRTRYLVNGLQMFVSKRSSGIGGGAIEIGTVNLDGTGTPSAPYSIVV